MEKNTGSSDRIFRLAAGLAIIIIGLVAQNWWGSLASRLLQQPLSVIVPLIFPLASTPANLTKNNFYSPDATSPSRHLLTQHLIPLN